MIKIFDQYLDMAEMLPIMRSIAVKIIQNDFNLPIEEGGTTSWENFTLQVKLVTQMNDAVQQMKVDLLLDGKKMGSITVDFDQLDDVMVEFEINFENDGYAFSEKKFELFDKSLMVMEKKQRGHEPLLSPQLPR